MRNKYAKVSDPSSFVTDPGSDVHVLYDAKLLPTGEIRLTPSGKESISEKINAEKQFTDIAYIRSRLALGDTSVLRPSDSVMYADLTKAPKTLASHLQVFINARQSFESLDLETRNKFNNNYLKWLQDAGCPEWIDTMKDYLPELVVEKDVKESEEKVSES